MAHFTVLMTLSEAMGVAILWKMFRSVRLWPSAWYAMLWMREKSRARILPENNLSLGRLERALALAAQIVLRHGAAYTVYLDRLERELEAAHQNDPTERARRILASYTEEGERKAMRSSQSRLCSKDGPTPYEDATTCDPSGRR